MMSKSIDRFNQQLQANILAHFTSYIEAEQAVLTLKKLGFDIHKLSLVQPLFNGRAVKGSRSSAPWWQYSATAASGGGYWICLVSGLVGILAGASLVLTSGLSLFVIILPLIGMLGGWLVGAVIGGIIDLFIDMAMPNDEFIKYQTKTPARDTIIWVTGSDEEILLAKQMLTNTISEKY